MNRLKGFDNYSEDIERQAKAAGVPLVATLVPSRAQAAMISMGESPAGFDPYNWTMNWASGNYQQWRDLLNDFAGIPLDSKSEQYYFPLDGHPDACGSAKIQKVWLVNLPVGGAGA